MPERFNFAIFLERPTFVAPSLIIRAAEKIFQSRLGDPLTTMQLDDKTGDQSDRPWRMSKANLPEKLTPQELFFVYYAGAKDPTAHGPIISFRCPPHCAIVTVSLEDAAVAMDASAIVRFCTSLYLTFQPFAEYCIVTAGAEIEIDAYSAAEVLQQFAEVGSLSQWAGGSDDAAQFLLSTGHFYEEARIPGFVLMRRRA
jgi:hypothetical protein